MLIALSAAIVLHVSNPPQRFDHPAANMTVIHASVPKVRRYCSRHVRRGYAVGCALQTVNHGCIVLLPYRETLTARAYAKLYRHERAHCNGWRHS